jgi:hypothetical protein
MNYAPLTWYEQEYLTYKAHFEALHHLLCVWSRWKFVYQDTASRSYRPVYEFIKLITQRLQVHWVRLATAYVDLKECAVTKEFCIYSLPVANVCNLLNDFISKCKLNISNMLAQNASYTYKIIQIHFKSYQKLTKC